MSIEKIISSYFESAQENKFTYLIPTDSPAFGGHFPGNPLLPGVCQLGLCADALGRKIGKPVEIKSVSRCKFSMPVRPGQRVQVVLTERPDGQILAELMHPQEGNKICKLVFLAQDYVRKNYEEN